MDHSRGAWSFPRSSRLTSTGDYRRVYQSGRRIHSASFLLVVLPGKTGLVRIGLSSGRKVGGAVVRNRVKRRMREILRLHRPRLAGPADLVLVAHPRAAALGFDEMAREVASLLKKAGLLAGTGGSA